MRKKIKMKIIEKTSDLSKKDFEKLFMQFVEKLEHEGIEDKSLRDKIEEASSVWNKVEIIDHMVKNILIFKDYDEDENEVNFSYKDYLNELLDKK